MLRFPMVASLALLLVAGGCGTDDSSGSPEPIPDTLLAGTLDGRAFTARSARAMRSPDPEESSSKWIEIFDAEVACDDWMPRAERSILVTARWEAGEAFDLSLARSVIFVVREDGTPVNHIVTSGRVEVVSAPAGIGSVGRLKLRGRTGPDFVEGAIDVVLCE
jgi:hypothetical protein